MSGRNFWFWFGGIWLAVGVPFLLLGGWFTWYELTLDSRLASAGETTQGLVLEKSWGSDSKDSSHANLRVKYRFTTVGGKTMNIEADVSEATWDALREREPIAVTYLPESPRVNRIDGRSVKWVLPLVFSALGAILTLLGGFIVLKAVSTARFARRLRTQGLAVEGQVSHIEPTGYRVNGIYQWVVHYRYRDHAGIEHEGRSPPMAQEAAERWRPGERVTVLFDRLRPGRSVWKDDQ